MVFQGFNLGFIGCRSPLLFFTHLPSTVLHTCPCVILFIITCSELDLLPLHFQIWSCFQTSVSELLFLLFSKAGVLLKMFFQESTPLLFTLQWYYELLLLCHPFIDSSIFLFLLPLMIKRPFTHISISATFKICSSYLKTQSHESTATNSFQHTHYIVFHLPPYNQFTFPCPFVPQNLPPS